MESETGVTGGAERIPLEFVPIPYQVLDSDGRICNVNDAWTQLLGYDKEEITGERFGSLLVGDEPEGILSGGKSSAFDDGDELELRRSDGQVTAVSLEYRIEYGKDDTIERVHCQLYDVTRRRERKARLRKFERAVESSGHAVYLTDVDGEIEYVNPAFEETTGYSSAEAVGSTPRILKSGEMPDEYYRELWDSITAGETWKEEIRNRRKDGSYYYANQTIAPVTGEDGTVQGFVAVQSDTTKRKKRQQKLSKQRERLRALFDESPDAITIHDRDGGIVDVNKQSVETLGYPREELLSMNIADIEVGHDPEELAELWSDAGFERTETLQGTHRRKDGTEFPVEVWISKIELEGETQFIALSRDITEQKARERELERYERLVENLPIGVYRNTAGEDGTFTLVNDGMVDMFDAESKAQLRNHRVSDLYVAPGTREQFSRRLVSEKVLKDVELELETLTGEQLWGNVTAVASEVDGEVVFDGVIQDISERKAYERELKEQRDNLDILNRVLRHDIRNDLQLVLTYTELLENHVDEEETSHLSKVHESAKNAVELTETARDLAEIMLQPEIENGRFGLASTLEQVTEKIQSSYPEAVVRIDGSVPGAEVIGNDMLGSLFRNLLKNGIQHNDNDRPGVTVSTTRNDADGVLEVRIADNGPGIPDEQKKEIFGKGEKGLDSQGTGIGLYLVQSLVESYGGDVWVEDNEPRGAVFVVELPLAGESDCASN